MMLPLPYFTLGKGMVPGFLQTTLGIQAKYLSLGFTQPENLVCHGLRVFWVPFGKLQASCRAFY